MDVYIVEKRVPWTANRYVFDSAHVHQNEASAAVKKISGDGLDSRCSGLPMARVRKVMVAGGRSYDLGTLNVSAAGGE